MLNVRLSALLLMLVAGVASVVAVDGDKAKPNRPALRNLVDNLTDGNPNWGRSVIVNLFKKNKTTDRKNSKCNNKKFKHRYKSIHN
jgi:hypothetical protein